MAKAYKCDRCGDLVEVAKTEVSTIIAFSTDDQYRKVYHRYTAIFTRTKYLDRYTSDINAYSHTAELCSKCQIAAVENLRTELKNKNKKI